MALVQLSAVPVLVRLQDGNKLEVMADSWTSVTDLEKQARQKTFREARLVPAKHDYCLPAATQPYLHLSRSPATLLLVHGITQKSAIFVLDLARPGSTSCGFRYMTMKVFATLTLGEHASVYEAFATSWRGGRVCWSPLDLHRA